MFNKSKLIHKSWLTRLVFVTVMTVVLNYSGITVMKAAADMNTSDGGDRLKANQQMVAGQHITSANGSYSFYLQQDANLVVYRGSSVDPKDAIWTSNTPDSGGNHLVLQSDGNLVLYKPTGSNPSDAVWNTGTVGDNGTSELVMQNGGNLVIYRGGIAVWASNSDQVRPVLYLPFVARVSGSSLPVTTTATPTQIAPPTRTSVPTNTPVPTSTPVPPTHTPPTATPFVQPSISYDVTNLILSGGRFRPNSTVYIRLVTLGYIGQIPDSRTGYTQATASSDGRLSSVVDPKQVLPVFNDGYGFVWSGCFQGEKMGISAYNDSTDSPFFAYTELYC